MQALGRHISNWWLLLLVPVVLWGIPFLLLGFIIGSHILGGVFGPPTIWERTRCLPPRGDFVGAYIEVERH